MEKEQLLKEFKKCRDDPIYFMSNYIKVVHPVRGLVKFKLYDFQERILQDLGKHRFNILRKFRQAGCTTIASAYALWLTLFYKHKQTVILSKGDAESTEVLDRIKLMYDELPAFLKPGIVEDNKHTLKLNTNSIIKSRPSGKQSGRSLAGSMLIVDEAAFIENIETIWAAVYPIISTGGRAFILSTVNGMGNWYEETYHRATEKLNSFNAIDINWKSHPEYNRQSGYDTLYEAMEEKGLSVDNWEKVTRSNMPLKQWLQEYECEFLGTGDTYIEGSNLQILTENINEEFYTKYNNRMRVWKDADPFYEYVIGVDTALGRDRDYSAFQVLNLYNGEQVAEFYSNKTPINEFAKIIAEEANRYNVAYVIVERNTIGNNLIDWLFNILEYDNLWEDESGSLGFQVTTKNREELLASLEEAIRTNVIKINSQRTVHELNTFVIKASGKAEAEQNRHDDLIMSLALSIYGVNTLINNTPVEHSRSDVEKKDPIMMQSSKVKLRSYGGVTEEDMKWLMN
tara:strand:- start:4913 stop:6451 length:1539 start_codon:yes stop_codon:yes gene_type:complete